MAVEPYIRYKDPDTQTDASGRARPIPSGVIWYATPAIKLIKPAQLPQDPDIAFADVAQEIQVEVGNQGSTGTTGANVTVWACGFGTNQADFAATLGGATGTTRPVPSLPANSYGGSTFVRIPWTPQKGELGGAAQLHCCIQANVFVDPGDREPKPPATNPVITPTTQLRHAQRNITLKPKPPTLKAFTLVFVAGNPDERDAEFDFEVRQVTGKLQRVEIAHLRLTPWVDREVKRRLTIVGSDGEEIVAGPKGVRDFELQVGKTHEKTLTAKIKGGAQRRMTLRAEFAPVEVGTVHRFDVIQRKGRRRVGAARVMTLALPKKIIDEFGALPEE